MGITMLNPIDVQSVLESFIKSYPKDSSEKIILSHIRDTVHAYQQALKFYDNGHYDDGLLARRCLNKTTVRDTRVKAQCENQIMKNKLVLD